jgi:type IV pilus assembly protein PilA
MLSPMKLQDAKREEGFTLIELLVVVIIIGILAAIAIPVFLSQRERAWRGSVQSDLRNAAVSEETYFTDGGTYTATIADLTGLGYNPTVDVAVVLSTTATGTLVDGQVYCMAGRHAKNTAEVWYLGSGGTLSETAGTGCPQATAPTHP